MPGNWAYPGAFAPPPPGPVVYNGPTYSPPLVLGKAASMLQEESRYPEESSYTGAEFAAQLQNQMMDSVTQQSHSHSRGSKSHPMINSPTGQAIFLEESPGMCNCPACPKEPNIGKMPWEQDDWGNPWDRFMAPR
jgi:hypothetical protein